MSAPSSPPAPPATPAPRLLDEVRQLAFAHFGRPEPGERYADWTRRFVLFHKVRHPQAMGAAEVGAFLDQLAGRTDLPPAAEVEARAALTFLYDIVLGKPLGELPTAVGRREAGSTGA